MEHKNRIEQIKEKLALVKKRELSCFGSEKHTFDLNPPAALLDIEVFERTQGIKLPTDYRDFLLYMGNGGTGPFYGIYPLEDWDYYHVPFESNELPAGFLTLPSPLKPGYNELPEGGAREDLFRGSMVIGEQGCGVMTLLIVTGEYRGRVVYAEGNAGSPHVSREKDFLSWYERWLDEMLAGYSTTIFGLGPSGGAADFFRIIDSSTDEKEVLEAFYAFGRLPQLDTDTQHRLFSYLDSKLAFIREAVYWVMKKHHIPFSYEQLERCLNDPAPGVRKVGIGLAVESDFSRFRSQIFHLALYDPVKEVAEAACLKLLYPGEDVSVKLPLSREEVLKLIIQSPFRSIRSWVAYLDVFTTEDIPLLLCLLTDEMVIMRANAITSLHRLKDPVVVPLIVELLERERTKKPEEKSPDDQYVISRALYLLSELGDTSCVPELLFWAVYPGDDFYRIEALGALAGIGDERGIPLAKKMLKEIRPPKGEGGSTSAYSISKLVGDKLQKSPHPAFRQLAKPWWKLR